jgi:hypothetical protein
MSSRKQKKGSRKNRSFGKKRYRGGAMKEKYDEAIIEQERLKSILGKTADEKKEDDAFKNAAAAVAAADSAIEAVVTGLSDHKDEADMASLYEEVVKTVNAAADSVKEFDKDAFPASPSDENEKKQESSSGESKPLEGDLYFPVYVKLKDGDNTISVSPNKPDEGTELKEVGKILSSPISEIRANKDGVYAGGSNTRRGGKYSRNRKNSRKKRRR